VYHGVFGIWLSRQRNPAPAGGFAPFPGSAVTTRVGLNEADALAKIQQCLDSVVTVGIAAPFGIKNDRNPKLSKFLEADFVMLHEIRPIRLMLP
jgi:hypothetical protein